ncbi:MAG: hypothetical protein KIT84_21580 [Labilithrix sp.]|nr:hypothetical protein [Labilithrix sp.]MCW5813636.1 hypothetical protein [Labilithrix sp.]
MIQKLAGPVLGFALVLGALVGHAHFAAANVEAPKPVVSAIVSDDASALREVLVHYVPEEEDRVRETYRDFLGTLPPSTRVVAVHSKGARPRLDAFLASIRPDLAARTRAIEVPVRLGIWSKDRALVLADEGATTTTFLVPPRPRAGESGRPFDWDIVPAVAAAAPDRFAVRELPIAFDAGDFAIAGKRILYDANLYHRNRGRGYPTPVAFRETMKRLVGRDVVMLGTEDGDVPRHHMSMYMAPLDGDVVLVGDPAAGRAIVGAGFMPGEKSLETHELLRADDSAATQARFDRAASDLGRAGFKVVRIPTVAYDDRTYFAYTNGVYETRDGKKTAWVPQFASEAGDDTLTADLDAAARAVYASLGWEVRPVAVRKLYPSHGTIGCVVNVLARE